MRVLGSRRSLGWRVFLTNAAVLIGVFVFVVVSPATVSFPVVVSEAFVLVAALAVSLSVNVVLLRRVFEPLDQLRATMRRVDPLHPGQRVDLPRADDDVAALADAFNAMLDRLEVERRESGRRALAAQEEERRRVARELHDELGQTLTGALLLVQEATSTGGDRKAEALDEAREAVRSAIDETRRIVRDLRPEALEDLGVLSALSALASGFERHSGVRLDRSLPDTLPRLSLQQELVIYRVAQEALTNVARHAGAQRAELHVERVDGHLCVTVHDDGRGMAGAPSHDGGIRGMHERALLVDGTVEVQSRPGEGTRVTLSVPVQAA